MEKSKVFAKGRVIIDLANVEEESSVVIMIVKDPATQQITLKNKGQRKSHLGGHVSESDMSSGDRTNRASVANSEALESDTVVLEDNDLILEGDAVIKSGGHVNWIVDDDDIDEIRIELENKDNVEINDIWEKEPEKIDGHEYNWCWNAQPKNSPEDNWTFDQKYSLHFSIKGCSHVRTIDPIIRVNK